MSIASLQFLQATNPEFKYAIDKQPPKDGAYTGGNLIGQIQSGKNIFIPQTNPIQSFGTEKSPSSNKKALLNTHIDSFQETLDREYSFNNTLKYVIANDGEHHPIHGEDEHELYVAF